MRDRYNKIVPRGLGALALVLLLARPALAADARSTIEAYLARLAGTTVDDLVVEQTFTLYHPDGRHPAMRGTQRLLLRVGRAQRLDQLLDGQREVRLTVGARSWVRQHDGRFYEAPAAETRRDRVPLLTVFKRSADDLLAEWRSLGVRADITDEVRVGGRSVTIVGARATDRDRAAVWVDPEYGIVRVITREQLPDGPSLVDIVFSDHRLVVDRFVYPYRQEMFVDGRLVVAVAVQSAVVNTRLSDDLFDPELLKRR
jgi:hypothetical protein